MSEKDEKQTLLEQLGLLTELLELHKKTTDARSLSRPRGGRRAHTSGSHHSRDTTLPSQAITSSSRDKHLFHPSHSPHHRYQVNKAHRHTQPSTSLHHDSHRSFSSVHPSSKAAIIHPSISRPTSIPANALSVPRDRQSQVKLTHCSGHTSAVSCASSISNESLKLSAPSKTSSRRILSVSNVELQHADTSKSPMTLSLSHSDSKEDVSSSRAKISEKGQVSLSGGARQLSSSAAVHLLSKKRNVLAPKAKTGICAHPEFSPVNCTKTYSANSMNDPVESCMTKPEKKAPSDAVNDTLGSCQVPSATNEDSSVSRAFAAEEQAIRCESETCLDSSAKTHVQVSAIGSGIISDIEPRDECARLDEVEVIIRSEFPESKQNCDSSTCAPQTNVVSSSDKMLLPLPSLPPASSSVVESDDTNTHEVSELKKTSLSVSPRSAVSSAVAQTFRDAGLTSSHADSVTSIIAQSFLNDGAASDSVKSGEIITDVAETCVSDLEESSKNVNIVSDDTCTIIDPPVKLKSEVAVIDEEDGEDDLLDKLRLAALKTMQVAPVAQMEKSNSHSDNLGIDEDRSQTTSNQSMKGDGFIESPSDCADLESVSQLVNPLPVFCPEKFPPDALVKCDTSEGPVVFEKVVVSHIQKAAVTSPSKHLKLNSVNLSISSVQKGANEPQKGGGSKRIVCLPKAKSIKTGKATNEVLPKGCGDKAQTCLGSVKDVDSKTMAAKQSSEKQCLKKVLQPDSNPKVPIKGATVSRSVKLSLAKIERMLYPESANNIKEVQLSKASQKPIHFLGKKTSPSSLGLSKTSEKTLKTSDVFVNTSYKLVRHNSGQAPLKQAPPLQFASCPSKSPLLSDKKAPTKLSPMKSIGKYKVVRVADPDPSSCQMRSPSSHSSSKPNLPVWMPRSKAAAPFINTKYKFVLGKTNAGMSSPLRQERTSNRMPTTPQRYGPHASFRRYPVGVSPLTSFKQRCSRRAVKRAMQRSHHWKMIGQPHGGHHMAYHHTMFPWQLPDLSVGHSHHFAYGIGSQHAKPRKGRHNPHRPFQPHRSNKPSVKKPQPGDNLMWKGPFNLRRDNSDSMSINQLLGRHVNNVSKSRYKFIKGRGNQTKMQHNKRQRLKVDHRSSEAKASGSNVSGRRGSQLVLIGGVAYRASPAHLRNVNKRRSRPVIRGGKSVGRHSGMHTVQVRGMMFNVSKSGRAIRRMSQYKSHQGSSLLQTSVQSNSPYSLIRSHQSASQKIASRSLHRSKTMVVKSKLKLTKKQKQFCMFYNRFGKCNRGDKCPYIHDPDKIAVCTRFLRGTCKVVDCPFSHEVAPEKMPVCTHYLRGVCSREACPYLHVNVGRDAEVCQNFIKGYCPRGAQCKQQHTLVCPEWVRSGTCAKNKACGMRHPARSKRRRSTHNSSSGPSRKEESPSGLASRVTPQVKKLRIIAPEDKDDITLPLSQRQLPAFIALNSSISQEKGSVTQSTHVAGGPLQIRPNLSLGTP